MCSKFWHEFDIHAIVPRIDSRLFSFFCNCVTHAVFTYKKKLKDTSSNEKKCSYWKGEGKGFKHEFIEYVTGAINFAFS